MGKQKDNSTFLEKVALRRRMLGQVEQAPVVMETHGRFGKIWAKVYGGVRDGVVFEKDSNRAAILARQRRTWAVYEGDCVNALLAGAGAHLEVNVLDLDPYGEPWSALSAFMESDRPRTDVLWMVVNDGLRRKLGVSGAWDVEVMRPAVMQFGNNLFGKYLGVCRWMIQEKAARAGYRLDRFAGYYCGAGKGMTHYLARLVRLRKARRSRLI